MSTIPVLIEKIRPIFKRIALKIQLRIEYFRERLEGFIGKYHVTTSHIYTAQEEACIENTVAVLTEYFPQNPAYSLLEEDYESRCEALENLGQSLIELYKLEGTEVIVTDDPDFFSENTIHVFGFTDIAKRIIYINAQYLFQDDATLIERVVSTVIHELRHMMQFHVMALENTYGVPFERRCAWRHNICNYVDAELDMGAYLEQPLEFDARNYVNRVWRSLYKKNAQ